MAPESGKDLRRSWESPANPVATRQLPGLPDGIDEWIRAALDADVTTAASAVRVAAVTEAGRHADTLLRGTGLGEWPVPGSVEWHAEEDTATPVRRERAWQLLRLRIGLGAGLDPLPTLIGLRRHGSTWAEIVRAAGTTRQSAHERWAARVHAVIGDLPA